MENHCFIFLKDSYPEWCEECGKMEQRIIEGDGMGAIHICGKMGEKISKEICRLEKLNDLCKKTQEVRIKNLNKKGILTKKELKCYDKIRKKRNAEVHEDEKIKNEMVDAYQNHENLYKITTWFYKKYVDKGFQIPKYKHPKSSFNQETTIEQHSNSHNESTKNSNNVENSNNTENSNNVENSKNTIHITNITNNYIYTQNNETKDRQDAKSNETIIMGVAIIAIIAICLSIIAIDSNNYMDASNGHIVEDNNFDDLNRQIMAADRSMKKTFGQGFSLTTNKKKRLWSRF